MLKANTGNRTAGILRGEQSFKCVQLCSEAVEGAVEYLVGIRSTREDSKFGCSSTPAEKKVG
jgi:hypothetical protein